MTKAQDRARERRRAEKLAERAGEPVPALRRDRQVAATLIGALILVIGAVWFSAWNSTRSQQAASDPLSSVTAEPTNQATGSPSTSATPTPSATPIVLPGCTAAPKAPGKGLTLTQQPDLAGTTGKRFLATITTNCGALTIDLYGDKAPKTVSSFRLLAEKDYWKNTPCHRLVTSGIFVLQCGDPTGTGSGPGPGYSYGIENAPADGKYPRGTLAMARTQDPNSNGDQFFIVYKDTTLPTDGGGYTIFGKVVSGLEIVDKVAAAGINPTDQTSPLAPLSILSASVKAKG
ncbi:MAG: peptidylprolyl isomerase [Actinomycetales bacterium]|nr:peptidylprolyl isomerase [Candidatus Lutibacillus vidarii]